MTTPAASPNRTANPTVIRSKRYRIRLDSPQHTSLCAQTAGACRLVWNLMLADCQRRHALRREYGAWTDLKAECCPDTSHVVVIEDLDTKSMTVSAMGTVEEPGTNVKQKAGLNREIPDYKAGPVVRVDPTYTSQTCAVCGHTANADHNTAVNIPGQGQPLARTARGVGASAQRGVIPLGIPATREPGWSGPSPPAGRRPRRPLPVPVVNSSV